MSDTPRTDYEVEDVRNASMYFDGKESYAYQFCVSADFARQLERELAAVKAERDTLRLCHESELEVCLKHCPELAALRDRAVWAETVAAKRVKERDESDIRLSDASHLAAELLARAERAEARLKDAEGYIDAIFRANHTFDTDLLCNAYHQKHPKQEGGNCAST